MRPQPQHTSPQTYHLGPVVLLPFLNWTVWTTCHCCSNWCAWWCNSCIWNHSYTQPSRATWKILATPWILRCSHFLLKTPQPEQKVKDIGYLPPSLLYDLLQETPTGLLIHTHGLKLLLQKVLFHLQYLIPIGASPGHQSWKLMSLPNSTVLKKLLVVLWEQVWHFSAYPKIR